MMTLDTSMRISGDILNYSTKDELDPIKKLIQKTTLNLVFDSSVFVLQMLFCYLCWKFGVVKRP